VPASFNRAPLLGESYQLDDNFRVRLRLARSSDIGPIRQLAESNAGVPRFDLAQLVQFDPRRRCVICATALIDSTEQLVGVGSIELDGDPTVQPDILLVGDEHAREIGELVAEALRVRAGHAARARAA
jgi:hypothetical protein